MTRRWTSVAMAPLLVIGLAGCAGGSVQPASSTGPTDSASPSSSASPRRYADLEVQYVHNRERATTRARHMLTYAVLPAGAVEQAARPAALPRPVVGQPDVPTHIDIAKYYRVPLSIDAAAAFVRSHVPADFIEDGGIDSSPNQVVGYTWHGPGNNPATYGQLSLYVAPINAASSYLRVDGGSDLLDPRPIEDSKAGPRLRIEAGRPCPDSDQGAVGVRNPGIDLGRQLAPATTAISGLLCSYWGAGGKAPFALSASRTLNAAQAGELSRFSHQADLSHSDDATGCPKDVGAGAVLVLDYPNQPALNLWIRPGNCGGVANGQVTTRGLDLLIKFYSTALAPPQDPAHENQAGMSPTSTSGP